MTTLCVVGNFYIFLQFPGAASLISDIAGNTRAPLSGIRELKSYLSGGYPILRLIRPNRKLPAKVIMERVLRPFVPFVFMKSTRRIVLERL